MVIVSMVATANNIRYGSAKTLAGADGGGTGDKAGLGSVSTGKVGDGTCRCGAGIGRGAVRDFGVGRGVFLVDTESVSDGGSLAIGAAAISTSTVAS